MLFCVPAVSAQSPEKIIKKYNKAIGGEKVISKITSVYNEGTVFLMDMQIPIKMTTLNGKGMRQEMDIMGTTMITCHNDKGGWSINPMAGSIPIVDMPDNQYNMGKDQIIIGAPFINYAEKGYKVELNVPVDESIFVKPQ